MARNPISFPDVRLRRLRRSKSLRQLNQQIKLSPTDFIYPLFVVEGKKRKEPIAAMPGQFHYSVDQLPAVGDQVVKRGIPAVLLFGVPSRKSQAGRESYAKDGIVQQALRKLKQSHPEIALLTDVCVCAYTTHGHCGVLKRRKKEWIVDNDTSLSLLTKQALSHAEAGADFVAPSAMMDGQVGAIRQSLNEHGFAEVGILAYSAKFASAFYGPFREAAASAPSHMDRASYQMGYANRGEAMREIELDIEEGADAVMVKPLSLYLDIVFETKLRFDVPVAGYNVSGEYSAVKAAAKRGWLDERKVVVEMLTAFKRAGCDWLITYWALQAAQWLRS